MSGVAAPSTLRLRRRSTGEPLALSPSLEIGAGGEARVFAVPGDRALVAKLYHEPSLERARKVALMIDEPPRIDDPRAALAWPADLLLGEGGRFAGFLMPRAEGPRLFELYNPITRRRSGARCDPAMLHRAGAHVAAAFHALHARGYVVGDVNESNVLLRPDGGVTLVDTDSFQVRDPDDGTIHRSKVGKPEFTPPELQGKTFGDFDRTPEHDRFGLGVLLFLALMEGTHPFAGRMEIRSETPPVEERIRRGLFPHHGHPEIHPPRLAPPFAVLDPEIRALFVRCFADGHGDPSARPAADEWREALSAAEARMETCGANRCHRFGSHLAACPWCARTALLHGRDPFPARPEAHARRDPAPRPARPTARRTAPPARVPVPYVVPGPQSRPPRPPRPTPAIVVKAADVAERVAERTALLHPGTWIAPSLGLVALGPFGAKLVGAAGFAIFSLLAGMGVAYPDTGRISRRAIGIASAALVVAVVIFSTVDVGLPAVRLPALPAVDLPRLPRITLPPREVAPEPETRPARARIGALVTPVEVDAPPALVETGDARWRVDAADGEAPARWCGHVSVEVGEDGAVRAVDVLNAYAPLEEGAARRTAMKMRFAPMTRGGRPVQGWVWFFLTCE